MKRKNFSLCWMISLLIIMVLSGCKSASGNNSSVNNGSQGPIGTGRVQAQIERAVVDYQGAATGAPIPEWVNKAIDYDLEYFEDMDRFQGRIPFIDWGNGQNIDLVRSWTNNFNMASGVSRRIDTFVTAEFGGGQMGDKDTPANRLYLQEIVAAISTARFSSLGRDMDYWVKLRIIDNSGRSSMQTEEYRYYVVYSMNRSDLQDSIDNAMGRVSAANQEQQEIKMEVQNAIENARLNYIQLQ